MNFRVTKSETIFHGKVFDVKVDEIEYNGTGNKASRQVAIHPGGAVILPIKDDGKIVLISQYRYPFNEVIYELPAGKLEKGEDPKDCATRELIEETGYSSNKISKLGKIFTTPGFCDEILHIYLAENIIAGDHAREEQKHRHGESTVRSQPKETIVQQHEQEYEDGSDKPRLKSRTDGIRSEARPDRTVLDNVNSHWERAGAKHDRKALRFRYGEPAGNLRIPSADPFLDDRRRNDETVQNDSDLLSDIIGRRLVKQGRAFRIERKRYDGAPDVVIGRLRVLEVFPTDKSFPKKESSSFGIRGDNDPLEGIRLRFQRVTLRVDISFRCIPSFLRLVELVVAPVILPLRARGDRLRRLENLPELKKGCLSDQFKGRLRILNAWEIYDHTILSLALNDWFRNSVLVDPIAKNCKQTGETVLVHRIIRRPLRLENDMRPALQVQAELDPPVHGEHSDEGDHNDKKYYSEPPPVLSQHPKLLLIRTTSEW